MAEAISERVAGVDPAAFWQECPAPRQWSSMVAKYEALAEIAALADGPRDASYRLRLAALAQRWPAALREGELIGPDRVAARLEAARAGLEPSLDQTRGSRTDSAARAVLCWAEIHELIDDIMRFRRSNKARETTELAAWLSAPERTEASRRWPRTDVLVRAIGPAVKVRSAYLCLAARAGLLLPDLHALLFARAGHWDHRPDDPPWAHP